MSKTPERETVQVLDDDGNEHITSSPLYWPPVAPAPITGRMPRFRCRWQRRAII